MAESNLIRVSIAAERLSVSVPTIHEMLRDGRLTGKKLGPKSTRVHRASIERLEQEGANGPG
jgi:excisionase family DNA binding protein